MSPTIDDYPRDMVGYGPHPPDPRWPGGANIALQFVLNYEEGGENNVLHGDESSETFLSEIIGAQPFPNRHLSMESLYEYGSRAGLWRVLRVFDQRELPLTIFGVATALARNPAAVAAFRARGDEIACHGLKWRSYQLVDAETERVLYAEGAAGAPKMLSVGLHCRLVGRPARIAALERFLDHVQSHDKVWITRRIDIARHWVENFPPGA
jgi:peptidoglycan/xylan/chitin deacetylase (PgdA/CDA1 family)